MNDVQQPLAFRRVYSTEFLRLRKEHCVCVSRTVKRKLQYFHIFVQHIPTRITSRKCDGGPQSQAKHRQTALIKIQKVVQQRKKKGGRPISRFPKLFLTNVRSINNKFEETRLRITSSNPDVVVITESWLDDQTPNSSIEICNYDIYRRDRNCNGGGILCYVRSTYTCHVLTAECMPPLVNCSSEILPIFIASLSTLLICVYHPFFNNKEKDEEAINTFVSIIDHFLLSLRQDSDEIRLVLCGDFNDIRKLNDQLCSLTGLKPCVSQPSRGSNILDQIYVNSKTAKKASLHPPIGRSDHKVILWTPNSTPAVTVTKKLVRTNTKANMAAFMQAAASIDWMAVVDEQDRSVDESATCFQEVIILLLDSFFPLRVIRERSNDPIWMKPSMKILLNRRDRAYAEKKWRKYERLRDEVIRHEKYLKARHCQLAMSSRSPKDFWMSVNSISRRSKPKSVLANLSVEDFSEYFTQTFQVPASEEKSLSFNTLPKEHLVLEIREVEMQLCKLKRKSSGPDGIPYWCLRSLASLIAPSVTAIFNRSLKEGRVPQCFKIANICPIPKTPNAKETSHFRPISLLPILSKTFERLVVKKWISPRLSHTDKSQFAYLSLPGRGTTCASTLIYHSVLRHLDCDSGAVRILSIDFAKAFDKLPHSSILSALVSFRIPAGLVLWVQDFLNCRLQRVCLGLTSSQWRPVPSGVPQGSVLGPLLFCAVISSLQPLFPNSKIVKYADDVNLLHFVRDNHEDRLQEELKNINRWSQEVGLPINSSKSMVMDIVTKSALHLCPITDESGTPFPSVSSLKILGITFSSDLRWDSHFQEVARKASKRVYVIRNLRRSGCPKEAMLRVYQATIQSLLLYGFPCFCNAPKKLWNLLEKVERRVKRIISYGDTGLLFTSLSVSGEMQCQRLFERVLCDIHHPLRCLFELREPTRRSALTLKKPRCRTARLKNSFIKFCN
jgi:hypothetical protein